ncbi:MAG TPA: LCP family protein [Propionibacteriaceae bacterium]|nr:LCP family protein [Propionibacteriaceae bacterium]
MPKQAEQGGWSWQLPDQPSAPTGARGGNPTSPPGSFRRAVVFTVAGTAIPGLGLIAGRRRIVGSVILGLFAAALLALGVYAAFDRQGLLARAVDPTTLRRAAIALAIIAIVWVAIIIASHLCLRGRPTRGQRAAGGILVGVLSFAVAAPMAVAAHYSYVTASSVSAVFKSENETKSATRPTLEATQTTPGIPKPQDPWAGKPRLNVLLLGGDAGPGRVGTRTDTVILASIDTKTGDTALFSLPRNAARMPFPSRSPLRKHYPYGYTNGNPNDAEYFLNAMYRNVPRSVPKDVLGPTDDLGADVLKLSVGEALGLRVDYYVLINLQGFSKMINALGGIRLNINTYIPIGGDTDRHIPPKDFLKPGPNQKLTGYKALWYARGRYGSDDFARMDRQRCVINAIIKQANPTNMLARYEDVVQAGKQLVYTDMPQEVLPLMVDLSLRVKDGNVRSIVFKSGVDGFHSGNPDFSLMRKRVKAALSETKNPKKKKKSGATIHSESVNDACAYDPKVAATARPYR